MTWFHDTFRGPGLCPDDTAVAPSFTDVAVSDTHMAMSCALAAALDVHARRTACLEHCARVAACASELADRIGLTAQENREARVAAQLHEIGMLTVPAELLDTSRKLTSEERARIRGHALAGAQIARMTHSPSVAVIIEHQYTDFIDLQRQLPPDGREVILAGVLRVADVFDALTRPRPYRGDVPPWYPTHVLRTGAGTRFHPCAVAALFEVIN